MIVLILSLVLLGALLVWELWVCEGAHLGRRFVVSMYDLAADRYDSIKHFDPDWERRFLGEALAGAIGSLPGARLLGVGAGTGPPRRPPLPVPELDGLLVCLDPSRADSSVARALRMAEGEGVKVEAALSLPFPAAT